MPPLTPVTILQIAPELDTGGVERTAVDVARACVSHGWRALVASQGGRLVAELEQAGGEHVTLPLASKNPLTILANARALVNLIRSRNVSLVHARSRAPAWSALIAARVTGVPFVTTYHGAYNQKSALKGLYNSVMARADTVIANSHFTKRLIAERHACAGDRVTVIHRGSDVTGFARAAISDDRLDALRAAWGLGGHERVILQMARITPWKGQPVTIDAFARLDPAAHGDCVLILAGDAQGRGGYLDALRARIESHGLGERVRLTGHCADVPAAMALACVVAVSSVEPEAFGRAAVEAQLAGAPVVVSDLGAVPETVLAPPQVTAEQRTGWRVPPGDPGALAAALDEALSLDESARKALTDRARAHAAEHFSLHAMCAATLAVYEDLIPAV
ncbi:glycosyltransferase family 4 protein [Breoghania sp. L-A4]|uniref:glycosyltransferase family 4 protein n=1 Tax=Breoghania sp. L-A4 TaxID=2304600 RepID=UPI0020BEDFC3|nr:glycosyltransferase family 4 protein [Breoghania sp. L-A4]